MYFMKNNFVKILPVLVFAIPFAVNAQMITGVWKGKINRQKAEVKIIQNGDSLTGTSYYYESADNYRRYSIRGYFDPNTNETVWWDDQLIEERSGRNILSGPGKTPMLSVADFNCPGSNIMLLDGKTASKEDANRAKGEVHLEKTGTTSFGDEWDFVIDNYTVGANDPYIIDSITTLSSMPVIAKEEMPKTEEKPAPAFSLKDRDPVTQREMVSIPFPKTETKPVSLPEKKISIQEKFVTRKREITTEIPVNGDSIELRFYDNAEIDGDSISLFLNDQLIFEHIRLTAEAYTIKIPVSDLKESNELVMVAENLGEIPPNTSYMIAMVGIKRYDAMLKSTEETSAVIRLIKLQ